MAVLHCCLCKRRHTPAVPVAVVGSGPICASCRSWLFYNKNGKPR